MTSATTSPNLSNGTADNCTTNVNGHLYSPITSSSLLLLFREQQRFLNFFFDQLDLKLVQLFCEACLECTGSILFTGVGKSGFIAQKIAQTLVSTGTKAVYLNATDALHGDLGIVAPGDLVVIVSKSGNTDELIRLVPYAKAKGAKLISVTSCNGSKLDELCDLAVHLPLERELCPFDLAPVTSTAIQMLFGDTAAIALMQAKHLTADQYAMNHPAGRIGKRLILRVSDLMLVGDSVPTVGPSVPTMEVLGELSAKGCGCVLVVAPPADGNVQLLGTFTDGDLRRSLQTFGAKMLEKPVSTLMNGQPVTCDSQMKAIDAMQVMEGPPRRVTFLPVVDAGVLAGLVTLHGLVSAGL
ncbi:hypothetical protein WJX73_009327 [Symbiochloris irregularis]|uniref:Uncharacterized protein n=1 Tax=Symbiochloris irregularis TaxID=706552 RepID=A0AAW1P0P3_9CHLO